MKVYTGDTISSGQRLLTSLGYTSVLMAVPRYVGAGAYAVAVFAIGSASVSVSSLFTAQGQAWSKIGRVTSSNRSLEVWVTPYLASMSSDYVYADFTAPVDALVNVFTVSGVESFGTLTSGTNTGLFSYLTAAGTVNSSLLDFFMVPTANATLTPGGNQTAIPIGSAFGSTKTLDATSDVTLSMSWKDGVVGANNYVWHEAAVSGEWIHAVLLVKPLGQVDPTYQTQMAKEAIARYFLAEVGAAEEASSGWSAVTSAYPVVQGTTTSATATFAHAVATGANRILLVGVLVNSPGTPSITSVTHNGKSLYRLDQAIPGTGVIGAEWWYLRNPDNTGNVVVTVGGSTLFSYAVAHTVSGVNVFKPHSATSGFPSGFAFVGSSISYTDGKIGELIFDAGIAITSASATAGGGQTSHFNTLDAGTYRVFGSRQQVASNAGATPTWTLGASVQWALARVVVVPEVSPSIYSKTFTRVVTGGSDRSGLTRTFDHIEVNGAEALKKNTVSELSIYTPINHSYFYDTATNTMYVRLLNDGDPTTYQSFTVEFYVLVGNQIVDFVGGDLYDVRLTGVLPSLQGEKDDLLFGVTSYPRGDIQLSNADAFFNVYSKTWYWKNRKVKLFYGAAGLTRAQYRQLGTMLIDDQQAGFEFLHIRLRQLSTGLQNTVPQVTFQQDLYAEFFGQLKPEVLSNYQPYLLGQVNAVKGILACDTLVSVGFKYDYVFAKFTNTAFGHYPVSLGQLRDVRAVDLITGVETSLEQFSGYTPHASSIKVHEDYPPEQYDIIADIGRDPMYVGQSLYQLLLSAGVPVSEIDAEIFARLDIENPIPIGIWQDTPVQIAELTRFIERSSFTGLIFTQEGYWSLKQWAPTNENYDSLPQLSLSDLRELPQPASMPSTPFFEVIAEYAFQPYWNAWAEASQLDASVIGRYKTQETFYLRTCLTNPNDAALAAQRYHLLQLAQPAVFDIEETGIKLIDAQILDRFRLTLPRAPGAAGLWDNEVVEVLQFDKQFNPERISVRIDDMHGLRARMRIVEDDYQNVVMQTRPVGYWRLEETSGVFRDKITFANNLTNVAGTVTYAQAGALANGNKSALFNLGTANAPNFNPTDGLTAVTLACWVKCGSAWTGGTNVALASTNTGHYIGINASNEPFFSLKIGGTQRTLSATSGAMNTTDWYFLVLTWSSGGPLRAYVNGVAAGTSGSFSGALTVATSGVTVGGISPGSTRIPAYIDEPAIWNRELHAFEIAEMYAARLLGAAWAASSPDEQVKNLYAADDATGRVDPSDPLSADHDIVW